LFFEVATDIRRGRAADRRDAGIDMLKSPLVIGLDRRKTHGAVTPYRHAADIGMEIH
jgi:hypothetical protein